MQKSVYPDDSSSFLVFLCVVFVLRQYGHTLGDAYCAVLNILRSLTFVVEIWANNGKGKVIALQTRCGPEGG
jgi:hypothetical protein